MDAVASIAVQANQAGEATLQLLVERHAHFLYRVAFNLLRHPQDAEDAVQETLLKLLRTGGWRSEMHDERAFLATAVWRVGLNRLGSAEYRAQHPSKRHPQDVTEMPLPSPLPNPEQAHAAAEQRTLMRTLIEALPDPLRQPLLLSAIEGMRSHEVAAILGIPEGTVRTRILRAKADLRQRFLELTQVPAKEVRA